MSGKETTLQLLEREYRSLSRAVEGLDAEQLSRVWFGSWSVRDIIAHILGWQRETTGLLQRLARGDQVAPDSPPIDADERNAVFVREMASFAAPDVLATWRQVHRDYVAAARAVPDDRFSEGHVAGRLVRRTAVEDFRRHAADIRAWRRSEGV